MYDVIITYPEHEYHKIYTKFYLTTESDARDAAIKESMENPESLVLIFRKDVVVDLYRNGVLSDRVETIEYYIALRDFKNVFNGDIEDTIQYLKETGTWNVRVYLNDSNYKHLDYYFISGNTADKFAQEQSKTNPELQVNLWYGTRCRKSYKRGKICTDVPNYDYYFLEEDNDYFKNTAKIWRELI